VIFRYVCFVSFSTRLFFLQFHFTSQHPIATIRRDSHLHFFHRNPRVRDFRTSPLIFAV
jgi:hypothetical protein